MPVLSRRTLFAQGEVACCQRPTSVAHADASALQHGHELAGSVSRHGVVAAPKELPTDEHLWDSARSRHRGQGALHFVSISEAIQLHNCGIHSELAEQALHFHAERTVGLAVNHDRVGVVLFSDHVLHAPGHTDERTAPGGRHGEVVAQDRWGVGRQLATGGRRGFRASDQTGAHQPRGRRTDALAERQAETARHAQGRHSM
mmetsp:Transcript_12856/g.33003  ORF Transcript_12856/g.33003 Transcript_12856/m.33003 type:complete len:202 (-) Transcript_12856:116-721(-)